MTTPLRALATAATLLALTTLSGCGGDDGLTDPNVVDISGTWNYRTTDVLVNGVTCSITGRAMIVTQNGDSFSGQLSGGGQQLHVRDRLVLAGPGCGWHHRQHRERRDQR